MVRVIATERERLIKAPILKHYEIILEKDTTECVLRSALFQEGNPVAYTSRTLAETEKTLRAYRKRNVGRELRTRDVPSL